MKKIKNNYLGVFIFFALSFIFIVIGATLYFGSNKEPNIRGTFGDMFGAANALFTGLSFVGLIVTILLQRQDINEQRNETNIQSFENTFFNLMTIHREIVSNLEKKRTKRVTSGLQKVEKDISVYGTSVFIYIYHRYVDHLQEDKTFNNNAFLKVYKENWEVLGHYFRSFINILQTIDRLTAGSVTVSFKQRYIDILKVQLSEYEAAVLFYYFLSTLGKDYQFMANKYNLFEFINIELVSNDIGLYDNI